MKPLYFALALISAVISAGCKGGGGYLDTAASDVKRISISSLEVKGYSTTVAKLIVKGKMNLDGTSDLSPVTFFSDSQCMSAVIGQGVAGDLRQAGIEVQVPSSGATGLYASTNLAATCFFLATYEPSHAAPPVPTFLSLSPASPSRATTTPRIFAAASATTDLVRFYDNVACTNLVGSGTPADLSSIGLQLALQPNLVNHVYVQAVEAFGNASSCTELTTFTHSTTGPTAPAYSSTAPTSPSRVTNTPFIVGTASVASVSVSIYSDAACGTEVGTGTTADFIGGGVQVTLANNASSALYGKAIDTNGNPSVCSYLTTYVHDSLAPLPPTFNLANPASPTRLTIYPRIKGFASSDTATVRLYNAAGCISQIGTGTKSEFESTGVLAGATSNSTISIYAVDVDLAGNPSACAYLTDYRNNTIAPDPPVFNMSNPISPNNQSTTPLILGAPSARTVSVQLYKDANCTLAIGSGTAAQFDSPGIGVTLPANTISEIYATGTDAEGNVSTCASMMTYAHSALPAPNPGFIRTSPVSPSRISKTPFVVGTAASSVSKIGIFDDAACTNRLALGNRLTYTTSGVQVTLPANTASALYGQAIDVYGNFSSCVSLTTYTHADIPPYSPTFTATSPASPTKVTATPLVSGTTPANPASILPPSTVSIYDSMICVNRLGTGTAADFSGAGITSYLPPNASTMLYAVTFDTAGNASPCTYMSTYAHSNKPPGKPILSTITPGSPSYSQQVVMKGTLGATQDILPPTNVGLYADSGCSSVLTNALPTNWTGAGVPVTMPANTTTTVYSQTSDTVANLSICTLLTTFQHADAGPSSFTATQNLDGSVVLSWLPNLVASPAPSYILKRSLKAGGPYTLIATGIVGATFTDKGVANGVSYHYVIAATNSTGTSLDSLEASITVGTGAPSAAAGLAAAPGPGEVTLTWAGFNTDMSFKVYRSLQRGGPYTKIAADLNATTYIDATVVNGTTYSYVVVGTNPSGFSQQSNEARVMPIDVPPAPTDLSIVASNSLAACSGAPGLTLSWSPPAYSNGFTVKHGNFVGAEIPWVQTSQTQAVDCNPLSNPDPQYNNQGFYFVVAKWGSLESPASNEVSFANTSVPILTVYPGNGEILLSWTNLMNVIDYQVSRATTAGGPYTIIAANNASSSYTDTAVTNGVAYYYRVISNYGSGMTGWPTLEQSGVPGPNATAPTNLIVGLSGGKPSLSWSSPSAFNRFYVYRAPAPGGPFTVQAAVTTPQFVDNSPVVGVNYYRVTTAWGSTEFGPSNTVSFRHAVVPVVNLSATASNISLSYAAITGVTGYEIHRSTTAGGPYSLLGSTGSTSFVDATAASAQGYYYVVRGTFADGSKSEFTLEVSGMRTGTSAPGGLTVTSTSSTSVGLAWAKVSGASSYKLYRATALAGPYTYVPPSVTATNGSVGTLASNTTYYFAVTALTPGESLQSTSVSARTAAAPGAPTPAAGNNRVDLVWGSVAGASSVAVERSSDGVSFATIASGIGATNYTDLTVANGQLYFYRLTATYTGMTLSSPMSAGVTPGITPRVPAGLTVMANSTGVDVLLGWGSVSGTSAYNVYMSTTSGGPWGTPAISTSSPTGNLVSGLTAGQTYYFVVSSLNGTLESAISPQVAVQAAASPAAPSALAVGPTSVGVTWSSISGAVSYDVQRSDNLIDYSTIATGIATTSYTDSTVVAGGSYNYRYLPSLPSSIPMAVSAPSLPVTPGTAPLATASLTASASTIAAVDLAWIQVPNAAAYNVYRGTTSGGPYILLGSVSPAVLQFNDATVVAGTTYYYMLRTANASNVESLNSNEAIISLTASPTGLAASVVNGAIDLSWSATVGATSYNLRRSEVSGGPYGLVSSGSGALSYHDANVLHGIMYYYVVEAVFASTAVSPASSQVSATAISTMNLEVPIEMVDRALSSKTTPVTFERTQTSLDTTAYDGTVSYKFEMVARNFDGVARSVSVVDSAGVSVGSISVPAGIGTSKRLTGSFVPNAGADVYRVKIAGSSSADSVSVDSLRLLIKQVGASKTKIFIPLLASSANPSSADAGAAAAAESVSSNGYNELLSNMIYHRDTSLYSNIDEFNAWELETVFSAESGASGAVSLYNTNRNLAVDGTETLFANSGVTLVRASFDEGTTSFDSSTEFEDYQVRVRCASGCTTGTVSLYRAGLWVSLHQITKARLFYRNSLGTTPISSATNLDSERTFANLSAMSNPVAGFQAVASTLGGSTATIDLMDAGTADQFFAGLTPVASSTLTFNSTSRALVTTSGPLTIVNGNRYIPRGDPGTGTLEINSTTLVIDVAH